MVIGFLIWKLQPSNIVMEEVKFGFSTVEVELRMVWYVDVITYERNNANKHLQKD